VDPADDRPGSAPPGFERFAAAAVAAALPAPAAAWFREALAAAAAEGAAAPAFARAWSGAGRRLGRAPVAFGAEAAAARPPPPALGGWAMDEAGRATLLLAALGATAPDAQVRAVEELWRTGEVRERQALMKVLAHLPGPERFAALGAEAVRTHMLSVFEALACENPYPARHLPPLAFCQLVVKALQNGVSLARIVDLDRRRDAELGRMVEAFASERRAAGRPVPDDVSALLSARPPSAR
jgi:hypothetical protein